MIIWFKTCDRGIIYCKIFRWESQILIFKKIEKKLFNDSYYANKIQIFFSFFHKLSAYRKYRFEK